MTKLELQQALNKVIEERDQALSALSQLKVQLEAERTVGRTNVRVLSTKRAAMEAAKLEAIRTGKTVKVNYH